MAPQPPLDAPALEPSAASTSCRRCGEWGEEEWDVTLPGGTRHVMEVVGQDGCRIVMQPRSGPWKSLPAAPRFTCACSELHVHGTAAATGAWDRAADGWYLPRR